MVEACNRVYLAVGLWVSPASKRTSAAETRRLGDRAAVRRKRMVRGAVAWEMVRTLSSNLGV